MPTVNCGFLSQGALLFAHLGQRLFGSEESSLRVWWRASAASQSTSAMAHV